MANDNINYAKKINELLMDMPEFVSDYIYSYGSSQNYTTKYQYARDIKDFLQYVISNVNGFDEIEINALTLSDMNRLTPMDINRYLTMLLGSNGLKETTVKRRRATLSSMYSFFVLNDKLLRNPVLATKPIEVPEKDVVYLTDDEQALLLETVRTGNGLAEETAKKHNRYADRDTAMFLLLLDTGLRVSEMLSTDIIDYDLEKGSVLVTRKGGDSETVYYSDECASYLDIYFSAQRVKYNIEDNYIPAFTTISGERLGKRAVETLVKKYVAVCMPDKVKIISPHKLRSSFAMSFYAASDNNILLLQKKLHHKSINTTNIYAKASVKDSENSRNLLAERRNCKKM